MYFVLRKENSTYAVMYSGIISSEQAQTSAKSLAERDPNREYIVVKAEWKTYIIVGLAPCTPAQ